MRSIDRRRMAARAACARVIRHGAQLGAGPALLAAAMVLGGGRWAAGADLPWTGNWMVNLSATSGDSVRAFGASTSADGQIADTAANKANAYVRATADAASFLSDSASTGLDFDRKFKPTGD